MRAQVRRGVDVIKIMTTGGVNSRIGAGLGRQMFDDEAQALIETAHLYGKKVAVHAHGADGINLALKYGADSIEHGTLLDEESVKLFLKSGAYYVPTLSTVNGYLERIAKDPNAYPPEVRAKIDWRIQITGKALELAYPRGVKIAFGTDAGVSKHGRNADEFELMVKHGMPAAAAIKAATSTPPTCSASPRRLGSIEPGKRADLIAVAGDPLSDVTVLKRVVVRDEGRHRAQTAGSAMKKLALALALVGLSARACRVAAEPAVHEGDFVLKDFRFTSGETLPELRLHYRTLGKLQRDARGVARNAVLIMHGTGGSGAQFLRPEFAGELFREGGELDAARFFVILPDGIGHGQSSKPSDGLRARFPRYGYDDMIAAQYRLVTEGLGVKHLRLVMGTSMGGMHTWLWGQRYPDAMDALMPLASLPSQISGRNRVWRRIAIDAIRLDPQWRDGDYREQPPGLRTARADAVPDGQQSGAAPAADARPREQRRSVRRRGRRLSAQR